MVGQARVAERPADVRFIPSALAHVRFVPNSGHSSLKVILARYSRAHDLSSGLNIASISTPSSDSGSIS